MKKRVTIFLMMILSLSWGANILKGQEKRASGSPFNFSDDIRYGNDILIHDDLSQDQRSANLSIAYNGSVFSAFTVQSTPTSGGFEVWKSTDNGQSWSLFTSVVQDNYLNKAVDVIVCGTTEADLSLFITGIAYFPASSSYAVYVDKYNATTGAYIGEVFSEIYSYEIYDVRIASDYKYPSTGSSPYSVAVLFSRYGSSADELIFQASADGGTTFPIRKIVATTGAFMGKVSLSHGRSASSFGGKYFAAWEQKGFGARTGATYVSHSEPFFDSDWASPTRLDDIAGFSTDLTKNPVVVCQESTADNSSGSYSTIVLFDRDYYGTGADYDVIGMYTRDAGALIPVWTTLYVANTDMTNEFEADAGFDPGYNNFLVTFCDSTHQNLYYVVNGMDLTDPSNWGVISGGFNQYPNLVHPFPKVDINPLYIQAGHVWVSEGAGGQGMATWDAEYITGIPDGGKSGISARIYPNPCKENVNLQLELEKAGNISVTLLNVYGQRAMEVANSQYQAGENNLNFNISDLASGYYTIEIQGSAGKIAVKLMVTK
jgi:hypothetical protein